MKEIGAFEAKNRLGALLDLVEGGEEIVITRHGRKVARLVPNEPKTDRERASSAAERVRCGARALKLDRFDRDTFKSDRDLGRPRASSWIVP